MVINKKATLKDIKDFRKWLEGKTGRYDPQAPTNCLVCQYMKDRGATYISFSGASQFYYHRKDEPRQYNVRLPVSIAKIAYGEDDPDLNKNYKGDDRDINYTYEAARERADRAIHRLSK